jgi:D-lactate dehydrogenase
MKFDVCFYEAFEEEEAYLRKYLPAKINAAFTWKTIQEAGHKDCPAAIISIRTQSALPLQWANDLKVIISRSTGFDHLLEYRRALQSTSIQMGYLPLYCNRAVAEQAMLLWTALMRKLPLQMKQFKTFERDGLTGWEVQGKNIVIYGVGHIGYQIFKIARGLEMNVFGVDIVRRFKDVKYISPAQGAQRADIIVSAMNLTSENHSYFNSNFFQNAQTPVIFVNISRGEISPATEVLQALQKKWIAAAALDVFDNEREISVGLRSGVKSDDRQVHAVQILMQMENVILTPHNAFNTQEAVDRKCQQTIEQLLSFIENKKLKWPVDEQT